MTVVQLRDICGVRSGDKGDISDLTLFADDEDTYQAVLSAVTIERVRAHFGGFVAGPIERFEAHNVWAVKFVMQGALGGGGPRSLRSDNLGKTLGAALLRLEVDLPDDVIARSVRRGRRAPLPGVKRAGGSPD
jgi:hypothetical protein